MQKLIIDFFSINDNSYLSFSSSLVKCLFGFLTDDVNEYSVVADRKHFYYMYGKEHLDNRVTIHDFKRNIKQMPETDQLAMVGVSQNQGLVTWYNETKDILKGFS